MKVVVVAIKTNCQTNKRLLKKINKDKEKKKINDKFEIQKIFFRLQI